MELRFKYKKILQWFLVFVLLVFLIYTLIQIVGSITELKREGFISRRNFHKYSSKPQINDMQSWMTFRYINVIFSLPPEYLKTELNILDKSYPNIAISVLAKKNKINPMNLLSSTQQAVQKYLTENTPANE